LSVTIFILYGIVLYIKSGQSQQNSATIQKQLGFTQLSEVLYEYSAE